MAYRVRSSVASSTVASRAGAQYHSRRFYCSATVAGRAVADSTAARRATARRTVGSSTLSLRDFSGCSTSSAISWYQHALGQYPRAVPTYAEKKEKVLHVCQYQDTA
eukprot:3940270-Rhodomonas_salina.1